jgi:multidrug efflux pump subunit AcrA (membrane-fusion protein)
MKQTLIGAGGFTQHTVQLGRLAGESYTALSGLRIGERVVMEGSFLLRTERLRRPPAG